jgi:hypothetical protein
MGVKHPQTNGKLKRFSMNISVIDMSFLHSKSLSSGITIDHMVAWSSNGLKPQKWHFEGNATGSVL